MTEQQVPLTQALGFVRQPFDKNIPTKSLFISQQISQLFTLLNQFLHRRGIALITGEIGAGKSTAVRAFIDQLEPNQYDVAYISDPTVGIRGILNAIAIQLRLEGGYFKWQLLESLKQTIEKNAYDFNKTTLLVIDEVQHMNAKDLEQIRLFTNFKIDSQTPLNLVLLGQADVNKTIRLNSMQALWQRTAFRYHLAGLNKSEATPYITHHLTIAGKTDPLFTDDVINEIFQQAKGIPRVINNLCYACLTEICQQQKNIVDVPTLEKVLVLWDISKNI
jgi:type II secretory pathway predicted ATPase ExeA